MDRHLTIYQQHVCLFSGQDKMVCPQQQLLDDIQAQVKAWQSEGDMVFIMANINEDICKESIHSTF